VDMGPGAAEIAELVPELRERIGSVPTAPAVEGEQARFRLFDSVTSFLKRAGARQPLVLVVDDLHWADEASLHLLRFFVGEIHEARLLVVATYRDVELRRGHPLVELLGQLARESVCERIPLRGLDVGDTGRFIEGIVGAPAPDKLTSAIHEMTEGNPFFIREVMRLLVSEGQIEAFQQAGSLPLALPPSVRAAIGRRLDGLSQECNALLRTASVLGREFSGALLERVTELPGNHILERLDEALAAGVLDEGKDALGRYAFHHALIRQTLYDELTLPERLRLHRRAGEAIEEACGAHPEPHLAELAHHFFQAAAGGEVGKAVDTCVRAAEYAHRLLAYEESAQQYERAIEALELRFPRDEVRRCELLLSLGEARLAFGARDRARAAFEAAADRALAAYTRIAQDLRQPAFLFQATFCQGSLALARGDFGEAERLFREALERGRGTIPYAHFMFTGQMQSLVFQRDGVDDAELDRVMFGEMFELPYSWQPALRSALAVRFVRLGEIEAARREFEALAEHGFSELRRDEHWLATMLGMSYLAVLLEDRRRAELLYDLLEPYADLVIVHDLLRATYGSVASLLGTLATVLERYDEGAAHYERAIAKETAMGARPWCLGSKIGYARLLLKRGKAGDHRRAEALVDEVKAGSEALGIRDHPRYLAAREELATARSSGRCGGAS